MTRRVGTENWWRVAGLVLAALVALFSVPLGALDADPGPSAVSHGRPAVSARDRRATVESASSDHHQPIARRPESRGLRRVPVRPLAVIVGAALFVAVLLRALVRSTDPSSWERRLVWSPVSRGPPLVG